MNITLQNLAPFIPLGINPKPLLFEIMRLQGMGDVAEQMDVSPEAQLEYSPEGEVQLLQMGKKVKIDLNDDHQAYIEAYLQLLNQPKLPDNVKQNTIEALGQRQFMLQALKLLQTRMSESPNNA
jgi:hypothetical protein